MVGHGVIVASGWTLDDRAYLESVDTEGYRGNIANSRDMDTGYRHGVWIRGWRHAASSAIVDEAHDRHCKLTRRRKVRVG